MVFIRFPVEGTNLACEIKNYDQQNMNEDKKQSDKRFEFDAVINKHPELNAGFIEFPFDVKKEFNGKNRVKVKALIDGHSYKGSLVKMGSDCHWLGITQEIRKASGKNPGDKVHVIIEEDTEERIVEIPGDFMDLLKEEPVLLSYFNNLSFTHRKEYVRWITEAKKEDTRKRRLVKAIEMLGKNIKTPL